MSASTITRTTGSVPEGRTRTRPPDPSSPANQIVFRFAGGSNLDVNKDMHMHAVTYTFVDKDTLKAEWTHYMDGKEGGKVMFELKRKK